MVQESQKFLDVCACVCPLPQVGLCHIRVVSLAWGGEVQVIRVINEKQLLLVMVGINLILSFEKEYVKLAW
jgi:hypothetical protein